MNRSELEKLNIINNDFVTCDFIEQDRTIIKKYRFYEYEISVEVDEFNKFMGISGIKINREFIQSKHRRVGSINIEDLYED